MTIIHTDTKLGVLYTYSGLEFKPFAPDPDLITLEDIARALSNICRYGGHTKYFYSVADHSMRVADRMENKVDARWALLHDASEAYLGDIPAPLKKMSAFAPYAELERNVMIAVCQRFDLPFEEPENVYFWDKEIRREEMAFLTNIPEELHRVSDKSEFKTIVPLTPEDSYRNFLRYADLLEIS